MLLNVHVDIDLTSLIVPKFSATWTTSFVYIVSSSTEVDKRPEPKSLKTRISWQVMIRDNGALPRQDIQLSLAEMVPECPHTSCAQTEKKTPVAVSFKVKKGVEVLHKLSVL